MRPTSLITATPHPSAVAAAATTAATVAAASTAPTAASTTNTAAGGFVSSSLYHNIRAPTWRVVPGVSVGPFVLGTLDGTLPSKLDAFYYSTVFFVLH